MRDPQYLGRALGIGNAVNAAAGRFLAVRVRDAKTHRDPRDIAALFLHQTGRDGRIHPPAHRDKNFFGFITLRNHFIFLSDIAECDIIVKT